MTVDKPIYTIGYGNRKIFEFIRIIKEHKIELLVDVRSNPFSRFKPDYRKSNFSQHLQSQGISYCFLGDKLGGKPTATELYDEHGKLDYSKVGSWEHFQFGINQLEELAMGQTIAIMCAELEPDSCHRKTLISPHLIERGITVRHIGKNGLIVSELF